MAYSGIQMFIEKLNQLINNSNHIPLFNNPSIISERHQFQLLYDELGSLIQTLFINQHQELAELNNLKKRFTYAADKAEYMVDLFLSDVQRIHLATCNDFNPSLIFNLNVDAWRSSKSLDNLFLSGVHIKNNNDHLWDFNPSLSLDDIHRSLKFIKVEYISMRLTNNIKIDSSPIAAIESAAGISYTRNSQPSYNKSLDEIIVGFDSDAELIRDKLVEDVKKVDVVSIVGMGGIGKTTLATKVFNDRFVMHHFRVRVWVTVSQRYDKRDVLIQILDSIRAQLDLEKDTDSRLREIVHKHLMGKRYLIVIDDIWHAQTWDEVKLFFPHDNTGSRILLTTRLVEVAKHANSDGFIHHLGCLSKEKGWELLCKKVFRDINEYSEWSIKLGMQIVENCKGLPLSVIVIAGIIAKAAWSEELWVEIADKTSSYIVGDQNGCIETLALSYNNLPLHLRECFLYLGGFSEDHRFEVKTLIWLWVAEGFIQQAGNKSMEDIAESYLMDLIDRNLVIVSERRKSNGAVKACTMHDLVRELCMRKSKEEGFILGTERLILLSNVISITPPYKPVRMFIYKYSEFPVPSTLHLRSIFFFNHFRPSLADYIAKYFRAFMLLRVLDLQSWFLNDLPSNLKLLVHLKYLAIWIASADFPSSLCSLWGLQTLIYITSQNDIELPRNISDMVHLRHLWNYRPSSVGDGSLIFPFNPFGTPMNLQTTGNVKLGCEAGYLKKCFPYIKELTCTTATGRYQDCDFKSLTCLEKLKFTESCYHRRTISLCITYPATLRSLTLREFRLPWSHMSIIQSLPNLQVLKLKTFAFSGHCWKTDGYVFQQLKFLRLEESDIHIWEACTTSFPCLRQLEIYKCYILDEIPLEIGDIPTLELIRIELCNDSLIESVRRIEEEQNDLGNYDLEFDIL